MKNNQLLKIIKEEVEKNLWRALRETNPKQISEWADELYFDNERYSFHSANCYPFIIDESGNVFIGNNRETHHSILSRSDFTQFPYISGRIWVDIQVISFWDYPDSKAELMQLIEKLNKKLKPLKIKIDNLWKVEVSYGARPTRENPNSIFVRIYDITTDALKHPLEFKKKLDARRLQHTTSPIAKGYSDVPSGMGSEKMKGGLPPAQYAMMRPAIAETKTKYKKLLKESLEHKIALELIRDKIKGTEWEGKVFLAGGAVRDELLGKAIKDLDVTVAAPQGGIRFAEWFAKELGVYKPETNPVTFPKFGTAKVTLNGVKYKGHDLSKIDVECVMTRKEHYPDPTSRKPEVDYGTPYQDAERRDLTINSLMKDLSTGEIKDFTGKGMEDIKNKVIRTPIDPNIIYKEDPLRMLRTVRFTVKYGWKLPMSMIRALKTNAPLLQNISAERIQDELNKILMTERPHTGIKLLELVGLNKYIAPEFQKLVGMAQNEFHQWTADKHTYNVIKNSKPDIIVRLAAFFHDIGKGDTKSEKGGKVHFYGHEFRSAELARQIMTRLKYPNDVIEAVVVCVKNHMRTKQFGQKAELVSDKALRKLMNDLGDHLETALEVIHADNISHGDELEKWQHNLPNQVEYIRKRMKELGDFTGKLRIPINGNDVLELIKKEDPNFKPSKMVGDIMSVIKDKFLENPKISKEEAEKIVVDTYNQLKNK